MSVNVLEPLLPLANVVVLSQIIELDCSLLILLAILFVLYAWISNLKKREVERSNLSLRLAELSFLLWIAVLCLCSYLIQRRKTLWLVLLVIPGLQTAFGLSYYFVYIFTGGFDL